MLSAERKGFCNEMKSKGGIGKSRIPVALTAVSCLVLPVVNIQGVLGVVAQHASEQLVIVHCVAWLLVVL